MTMHSSLPFLALKTTSRLAVCFRQKSRNVLRVFITMISLGVSLSALAQDLVPSATASVFVASNTSRTFGFEEQKVKIGVGGLDYNVAVDASWLTATKEGDGVLLNISKNSDKERTAQLTISSGNENKKIALTQQANPILSVIGDPIAVSKATATSEESAKENTPITNATDGNGSTFYHSVWSDGNTSFPVTLTFIFDEAKHLDRIVYIPRGNGTGVFKDVTISINNGNGYTSAGSATFDNNDKMKTFNFSGDGVDNVKAVRIVVNSGYNAYISAAEIQFFDDTETGPLTSDVFADELFTKLKPSTTQANVDTIKNPLLKKLAQDLLNGTYSTKYRVGTYQAYRPVWNLREELDNSNPYDQHENPTGIYFSQGEKFVVMASGIGSKSINLEIYNLALEGMNARSTYALQDGINIFTASNRGTSYVLYYTQDYQTSPDIKLHFIYGQENGYFNLDTDDNAVWKDLLANAKAEVLDIVTPRIHMVAPLYALKAQCPVRGLELAHKLDSVIWREWEILGYFKHNRAPKNHQFVRPAQSGLYASTEGSFCAWGSFGGWVNPVGLETWGLAHELGHNNQVTAFRWVGMTEVTNNVKSAWVQYTLPGNFLRLEDERMDCIIGSVRGGRMQRFLTDHVVNRQAWQTGSDPFKILVPLWQMLLYTRVAEKSYDAYPDWYELIRKTPLIKDESNNSQRRLNFLRYFCTSAKLDFFPFYEKAGMLIPMDNVYLADYSGDYYTITQAQLNSIRNTVERRNFTKVPAEVVYINGYNVHIFRDNIKLRDELPVGTGCTATTIEDHQVVHQVVKIDNYVWQGAVGYETYDANGNLLHASIYGLGDAQSSDRYTHAIWKTSSQTQQPAYIMAVGYDGTRVKCYEP